jgi:hypothetical protein
MNSAIKLAQDLADAVSKHEVGDVDSNDLVASGDEKVGTFNMSKRVGDKTECVYTITVTRKFVNPYADNES